MKTLLFIIFLFLFNFSYSQELELSVLPIHDSTKRQTQLFKLKIFNKSKQPIAIKCSLSFLKYSENDTLELKIGDWYNGDNLNYHYGMHTSEWEGQISEPRPIHLVVISPQNYLMTNLNFSDLSKYIGKAIFFTAEYSNDLTKDEIVKFSDRRALHMVKPDRNFKRTSVKLYDSYLK